MKRTITNENNKNNKHDKKQIVVHKIRTLQTNTGFKIIVEHHPNDFLSDI